MIGYRSSAGLVVLLAGMLMVTAACAPTSAPSPWVPTQTITPAVMSESEAMALRDDRMQQFADELSLADPPTVELVRWTTDVDWGPTVAKCLRDAGFAAEGSGRGIKSGDDVTPDRQDAYSLAYYVCGAKYTMNPVFGKSFTADQWAMIYDYDVQWLVPCLARLGAKVSKAPDKQTYITDALRVNSAYWTPWNEAVLANFQGQDDRMLLIDTCPPYPAAQYLWGG